jgi:hypothetical protein
LSALFDIHIPYSINNTMKKKLNEIFYPCFGRHLKPLVPAVFAAVNTHQSALSPRGGLLILSSDV